MPYARCEAEIRPTSLRFHATLQYWNMKYPQIFPHMIFCCLCLCLYFLYFRQNLSVFCKIMERKKANSLDMDCSSKILKDTEDYVSKKLHNAYKHTTSDLFGIQIPSYVLRTAIFLCVVIFTFTTRFYLIHQPKHIW